MAVAWTMTGGFTVRASQDNDPVTPLTTLAFGDQTAAAGTFASTLSNNMDVVNPTLVTFAWTFAIIAFKSSSSNPTKLEISLFGTQRFQKPHEAECKELPVPVPIKRVM
jgi:hypothetical protein